MTAIEQGCIAYLARRGYRVFRPLPEPLTGSVWLPSRGDAFHREVVSASLGIVRYTQGGGVAVCTVASWRRWVQRARAVEVVL